MQTTPTDFEKRSVPTAERLGALLSLTEAEVEEALTVARSTDPGARVGEALLATSRISRDDLIEALRSQRFDRLRACALFENLDTSELARLAACVSEISLEADAVFIEQGEVQPVFYVLASGQLEVFRHDDTGEEVHLALVNPGETVGEMAYFANGVRSASVRALCRSELLELEFGHLPLLFETAPRLSQSFLSMVTRRLQRINLLYEENQYRSRAAQASLTQLNRFLELSGTSELGVGIEGLIERLVHTASTLMDADRASLFLLDRISGELWSKVAEGAELKEIRVPVSVGIAGWVAEHEAMLNITDAYDDDRFNQEIDRKTGYRTRTILCGPVRSIDDASIIGVIQVINKRDGIFTREDESLFRAFAHQAAIAVENFSLYRKMMASHERMAIMLEIGTSISQTLDLQSLIARIVARLTDLLRCERSSFFVHDPERAELWSVVAHGSTLEEIRLPNSSGLAGHAAVQGEVVNVIDAYEDARFNSSFDVQSGFRTRSVLCVPVFDHDGSVVGVTQVINKRDGSAFDAEDIDLLRAIASQIAVAVRNAKLHAEAVSTRNYLENVQESISNGIVTLDEHYRVVTANRAGRELFGLTTDDVPGADLRSPVGPESEAFVELLGGVYRDRTSAVHYDLGLNIDAKEHVTNVNVLPLNDAEDVFQGLVVVVEDVTQEKRVKSTLTRYMAQDIVERMLADPNQQALGGVRSKATVLFSDIRAFTSISEKLTAEQTMDMLNEYFTLMVEEVFKERGVLDKFIGDAMMAVFGVPFSQPDDAMRAVRAALNMTAALVQFNASWTASGYAPIAIGIGVNSDEIISGNMGSQKRMDYTVIGDGVNVASRLEGLNKLYGTTILISDATREEVGGAFKLRCLDRVILKGKTEPVPVYEVLGELDFKESPAHLDYPSALAAYSEGEFGRAFEHFSRHALSDPPSRAMAVRCRQLMVTPPDDWQGIWTAIEK